jgi:hypothetical protein
VSARVKLMSSILTSTTRLFRHQINPFPFSDERDNIDCLWVWRKLGSGGTQRRAASPSYVSGSHVAHRASFAY